ncbi:MAG TPA: DoxX family protein [Bacteroidota bacterium]|jgi:putative oxidoreductase|nr:DoxX family protein [Bacteroidota bacterium]
MSEMKSKLSQWSPHLLSVLRMVSALLFMMHGSQKLIVIPAGQRVEPVDLMSLVGLAAVLEFFGGLLLLVGIFTRPVAFLLSGLMAVAYFKAHAPQSFIPLINRGELAVLYCFLFLYFVTAGGGSWSVDELLERRKRN